VTDVRGIPQWRWFEQIEEEGKTVALGSKCKAAGHRLRSRRGHCVQCGHDQAAAARAAVPEPTELKDDIEALEKWVAAIRKRRSK
jgi:hypothetical protein